MVELTTKQQVLLATFSNVTQSLTEQFCTRLVLKNIYISSGGLLWLDALF